MSTVWFHLVGERRTGLKTQFGATVEGCPLRGTGEAGTAKPRGTTRGHPASDLASALPRDQHGPSIRTDPALDPAAARTRRQHVHRGQQPRHRGAWATLNSEGTWRCGITPAQHAGSRGKPLHVHCERMHKQVCLFFLLLFRASADEGITFCLITHPWPGSSWRPPACGADVVATRPQVL